MVPFFRLLFCGFNRLLVSMSMDDIPNCKYNEFVIINAIIHSFYKCTNATNCFCDSIYCSWDDSCTSVYLLALMVAVP